MSKSPDPSRTADILKAVGTVQAVRQTGALADAMKALPRFPEIPATRLSRQLEAPRSPQLNAASQIAKQAEALHRPLTVSALTQSPSQAFVSGLSTPAATSPQTNARRRIATAADLGLLVRERRMAIQLTQQDLADAANTGRRFISELETGKATLELGKVIQACRVLGIDLFAAAR